MTDVTVDGSLNVDSRLVSERPPRGYDPEHLAAQALRDTPSAELPTRRAELQDVAQAAGLTPGVIGEILNGRRDLPRPLLAEERATLFAVLEYANYDGRDALLAQAKTAQVVGYCGCGCASVQLAVGRASPPAPHIPSPLPNEATVLDGDGEVIGGVIVFLDGGYLSLLEVHWYDDPISPFPPLHRLELFSTDSD